MDKEIITLEELTMNAHPSLMTMYYDGWILRFSNGYTNRSNSVLPLYNSELELEEKVRTCKQIYTKQGLPTIFKLNTATPAKLDSYLEKRGYDIVSPSHVMMKRITQPYSDSSTAIIENGISETWKSSFFELSGITGKARLSATAMFGGITAQIQCARIEDNGRTVACGLCAIERGYAGLYDIVVNEAHRGRGYGYEICRSLIDSAFNRGASTAYLQVITVNEPAVALYKKLGFSIGYQYWYRKFSNSRHNGK